MTEATTLNQPIDGLIEVIGELKDRVFELEQAMQLRQSDPETQPGGRWTPCTPEEIRYYVKLIAYQ